MKQILKLTLLSLVWSSITVPSGFAGTIVVNLEGLSTSKGGKVYTAIFIKQNFLKFGEHLLGNIKPVTANSTQIIFDNVPAGSYGIAAFQDVDGSEDLSKNFFGIPKEPMGFSRNPRILFGPPGFVETEITVNSNQTVQITIQMK